MSRCWTLGTALLVTVSALGVVATGCGPEYPNCNKDEDCRESDKGQKQGKLYCVNGLCQECGKDQQCDGPGMRCENGSCSEIPNFCQSDGDCSGDEVCRDNRCGPECLSNDDCEDGYECQGGTCEETAECSTDADCSGEQVCRDGSCVESTDDTSTTDCELKTVYFDFDSSSLNEQARDRLESNADCIKQKGRSVQLAGHCDQRGSNEYNIALGERRAKSVAEYLTSLGVSSDNVETISYGEERPEKRCSRTAPSSCFAKNRRVEFSFQ